MKFHIRQSRVQLSALEPSYPAACITYTTHLSSDDDGVGVIWCEVSHQTAEFFAHTLALDNKFNGVWSSGNLVARGFLKCAQATWNLYLQGQIQDLVKRGPQIFLVNFCDSMQRS